MEFKMFEKYIKECEKNNIIPSLKGAEIYKKFGVIR